MRIKNIDLIKTLLWANVTWNDLAAQLFIVSKLAKKYWSALFSQKYIKEISSAEKNLSELIIILKQFGKTKYSDIKKLITIVKQVATDYDLSFKISSDSQKHNQELLSYIENKFKNSKTDLGLSWNLWVSVFWEWRYYKKNLDSDLKKILWI